MKGTILWNLNILESILVINIILKRINGNQIWGEGIDLSKVT